MPVADPTALATAHTRGPYYGAVDTARDLERAVDTICPPASCSELILLHGDHRRMRLMVNLIAQLNTLNIDHIMLLGFTPDTCATFRRGGRIGCVTSTHLMSGAAAEHIKARHLEHRFVAWLQRFRLMRRLSFELPRRVNVLALDTDLALRENPYTTLHSAALRPFTLLTTFDFKGGFANTNIGFFYIQNATPGAAVEQLFAEFERRVDLALPRPQGLAGAQLHAHTTRFLWDQNLFNKVLLSEMHGHPVFLPVESDADVKYYTEHRKELRARNYWREASLPTPSRLQRLAPWGESTEIYRWFELRDKRAGTSGGTGGGPGVGGSGGTAVGGSAWPKEMVAMAPAWVVALEQGFGRKGKHWLYGATPPPAAIVHYTCTTQTEDARIWPLRLFGSNWHNAAVQLEVTEAPVGAVAAIATAADGTAVSAAAAVSAPLPASTRFIALEGGSYEQPLPPRSWARLNLAHGVLGGLASLSGRTLVAPATNCSGARGDKFISAVSSGKQARKRNKLDPPMSSRCFWHVHSRHGVRCVLRIGRCANVATPDEAAAAAAEMAAAGKAPAVVTLDLTTGLLADLGNGGGGGSGVTTSDPAVPTAARSVVDALASRAQDKLVLVRLLLPEAAMSAGPRELLQRVAKGSRGFIEPQVRDAVKAFGRQCTELVNGPYCNNICS